MNAIELNHACTYATPEELYWLKQIELPEFADVAMIGAGPGVMAVALFEDHPHIRLTVIDIQSVEYVRAHVQQMNTSVVPDMILITANSNLVGQYWDKALDFLIIDGDHSYEGVKRDLDAWLKHVKPNGLVFLHDYDADGTCFAGVERYPGVKQAIEECSAHWEEFARVGTAIIMKVLA